MFFTENELPGLQKPKNFNESGKPCIHSTFKCPTPDSSNEVGLKNSKENFVAIARSGATSALRSTRQNFF